MTVYMTQTEYADYRGISQPRVSKLISIGKLAGCIKKISGKKLIDRDKADAALSENLDRIYNKPSRKYGKHKKDSVPDEEKKKIIESAGLEIVSLAEAQKLKENYIAAIRKLEYKKQNKELLSADEVKKAFADVVLSARTKILSIKGLLAPLLKEFIEDPENFGTAMDLIEKTIRDILEEMADSAIKK